MLEPPIMIRTLNRLTAMGFSLLLIAASAAAEDLIGPEICDPNELDSLSGELQAFCASIDGLEGRDLLKAQLLISLSQTNQPPVARLEVFDRVGEGVLVRPTQVDLDASSAFDPDGFVDHLTFMLFDAETGEVLAGPAFTREPLATLRVNSELPARLRATVTVEDGDREIDTTEISFAGPEFSCGTTLIGCSTSAGVTECQLKGTATTFTTADVLAAAQLCVPSISEETPLRISAWGGGGGSGGNSIFGKGAAGGTSGLASFGTTLASLDSSFGPPGETSYCYGIGQQGWHNGDNQGLGGASTILRTCENVDQTQPTGVLLIAGGGGGGGQGPNSTSGGAGGRAISIIEGACPADCDQASTDGGGGLEGTSGGGIGGSGIVGGQGGGTSAGNPGADGVGGKGGSVEGISGTAGWSPGDPKVTGDTGSGGIATFGGAGGGGYGGGGSGGQAEDPGDENLGGGGGGSFSFVATQTVVNLGVSGALPGSLGFFFYPASDAGQDDE